PVRDDAANVAGVLVVCNETTQKVLDNAALQESEHKLRFAIDATELGTWDLDPVTNKFTGNARLKEWFGIKPQEEIALSLAIDSMLATDRERVTAAIQRALEYSSGGLYDIEYSIIHPHTKKERIVRAKGKAWFNDEKSACRFNGTLQDITEQAQSRKKIEESELLARHIIQHSEAAQIIWTGEDMIFAMVNDKMLDMLGRDMSIIGKSFMEAIPELTGTPLMERLRQVYHSGETFHQPEEMFVLIKNGIPHTGYYHYTYKPLKNGAGETYGIICTAFEITDQVALRKQIEEAEAKARLAIESSDLGQYETNLLTYEIRTNERFDAIWGESNPMSRELLINMIHPDDKPMRDKAYEEAIRTGKLNYEVRIVWRDQSVHWVRLSGKVFYNNEGQAVSILGVTQDITTRKELERHKDDFVSMVSHELKTPLTSLLGFSQLLGQRSAMHTDPHLDMMVARMETQAKRLNYIVQDLLDVTRIEGDKIKFREEQFDFHQLLKLIVEEIQGVTQTHQVIIDRSEPVTVFADKERTSQVLTNLLMNAIKYSPKGSDVIVSSYRSEKEIVCSIKDTGPGISKENQAKIFERFYQVTENNKATSGLGLGLYISSEIIKRQQGRIWLESEPGKGATFYFTVRTNN
ncbi:MAG: ATP-binding protein, partial [Chitinophagaceae bacterium]